MSNNDEKYKMRRLFASQKPEIKGMLKSSRIMSFLSVNPHPTLFG